jgi:hypothetical protein
MHQVRISTTQVSSVMLMYNKLIIRRKYNWKRRGMKPKQSAIKLSQIPRMIELGR